MFFFFQAEDGIRDLVRSRGLGDVYKRQVRELAQALDNPGHRHEGHIALVGIEPPTGVLPADAPLERSGLRLSLIHI